MTVILSKWQKQHLLKEVYMCTDSWYTTVFLSPLSTDTELVSEQCQLTHHTWQYYPYLSFGACTLLILMALSGAVISIMWKTEGSFCLPVCAVSEAVPSIFHCRGGCFLLSGTVFPIMCIYSTKLHIAHVCIFAIPSGVPSWLLQRFSLDRQVGTQSTWSQISVCVISEAKQLMCLFLARRSVLKRTLVCSGLFFAYGRCLCFKESTNV